MSSDKRLDYIAEVSNWVQNECSPYVENKNKNALADSDENQNICKEINTDAMLADIINKEFVCDED